MDIKADWYAAALPAEPTPRPTGELKLYMLELRLVLEPLELPFIPDAKKGKLLLITLLAPV
jgi:hypothetical protein